jgi:hypothetical protein
MLQCIGTDFQCFMGRDSNVLSFHKWWNKNAIVGSNLPVPLPQIHLEEIQTPPVLSQLRASHPQLEEGNATISVSPKAECGSLNPWLPHTCQVSGGSAELSGVSVLTRLEVGGRGRAGAVSDSSPPVPGHRKELFCSSLEDALGGGVQRGSFCACGCLVQVCFLHNRRLCYFQLFICHLLAL